MRRTMILGLMAILALATACGSGSSGGASTPTSMQQSPSMNMGGQTGGVNVFGEPGDPAVASRTIDVAQLDTLRFDPESIDVKKGETVTFRVTNKGATPHEFVIGDTAYQQSHEQEMSGATGNMLSKSEPGVYVEPGKTQELTWTFTQAGTVEFACHVDGHYAAGMKGELTVSS